jgi:hypothetical protein
MTKELFFRSILPIGILFSGSLIMSNKAYLYLTVSFIQMLKVSLASPTRHPSLTHRIAAPKQAFTPVAILLISFASRIQEPNRRLLLIVLTISGGVCLASYGELHFNPTGFIIQVIAVAVRISPHRGQNTKPDFQI